MNWPEIATAAVTLFFIMDPLGNVPIFHAVLANPDISPIARFLACPLIVQGIFFTRKYTRYSAREENALYDQIAAREFRESVRYPG